MIPIKEKLYNKLAKKLGKRLEKDPILLPNDEGDLIFPVLQQHCSDYISLHFTPDHEIMRSMLMLMCERVLEQRGYSKISCDQTIGDCPTWRKGNNDGSAKINIRGAIPWVGQ